MGAQERAVQQKIDVFDQWCFHKMQLKTKHYVLRKEQEVFGIFYKAAKNRNRRWNRRAFRLEGTVLRYGVIHDKMDKALKELDKRMVNTWEKVQRTGSIQGEQRFYEQYTRRMSNIIKQHFVEKDRLVMTAGVTSVEVPSTKSAPF